MFDMKVHAYYQTFISIPEDVVRQVDHFIVSSVHFDDDDGGNPTIHLNDNHPDSPLFDTMWKNVETWSKMQDKHVSVMVGGAGKAFQALFSNYSIFFKMLREMLQKRPYITGIVLDVEERICIESLNKLVQDLYTINEKYKLYTSPCQFCMEPPSIGMGGFSYKFLEGVDTFLVQAYCNFSYNVLCDIERYWKDKKIVLGALTGTVPLGSLKNVTKNMTDVALWELGSEEGIQWVRALS